MTTSPQEVLLKRLAVLTGREQAIANHLRGRDGRLQAAVSDIASFTAADEVLEGLEDAALAEIDEIHRALLRIADGSYGRCVRCGKDIDERRLSALPATAFCRSCAI